MNDSFISDIPEFYSELAQISKESGFTMASDLYTGSLLKSLIASKPKGNFLELGTGASLSLCWMIDGMDAKSKMITLDIDHELTTTAQKYFGNDNRIEIVCQDGSKWLKDYNGEKFDLIFADAWPGKYTETEEALNLVTTGGFYVIDDMLPQSNWPEGHQDNVNKLIDLLKKRTDFNLTKMNWSTGIILAVKI